MVQRMSTEANRLKKFEPLDTRDFVDFSDRGPSCYLMEHTIGKKGYVIRFRDQKICNRKDDKRMEIAASCTPEMSLGMLSQSESITVLSSVPSTAFPKSVSIADLLQAQKLMEPPDAFLVTMLLESYSVSEKKWGKFATLDVLKENNQFSEGGFRVAYNATTQHASYPKKWVIKKAKVKKLADLEASVNLDNTQHKRKQVHMHAVVRSICQKFS